MWVKFFSSKGKLPWDDKMDKGSWEGLGRGWGGMTNFQQRYLLFPLSLQPFFLPLPEECSDVVVGRFGSKPQSGCSSTAASSVSPLNYSDDTGFLLYLSLGICSSAFFLVFLFSVLKMDSENLFLCLLLLLLPLIFSPDYFYIFFIVKAILERI